MRAREAGTRRRGAVLITFSLAIVVIFGFMGLAFDLGRLYLARNEAQSFCDAAALAGAASLNGTTFANALLAVDGQYRSRTADWKSYHFRTREFTEADYKVMFSITGAPGSFEEHNPGDSAGGYRFVQVVADAEIPMYLSPILTGTATRTAQALAVGAQVRKDYWQEGLVPFAPMSHCSGFNAGFGTCTPLPTPPAQSVPGFPYWGFEEGKSYTFHWGAPVLTQSKKAYDSAAAGDPRKGIPPDPNLLNPTNLAAVTKDWCAGDAENAAWVVALMNSLKTDDFNYGKGFWYNGDFKSTADKRVLLTGAVGEPIHLNDPLAVEVDKKNQARGITGDMNTLSTQGVLVYTPIVDPGSADNKIIGFASWELIPNSYEASGKTNWCAIYRGPAVFGTGTEPVQSDGIYEIRLVR